MDFERSQEQLIVRSTAEAVAEEYGPAHWRDGGSADGFAADFWATLADAGLPGLLVPADHGGAGLGMQELGLAMETLCGEGCGMAGAWYLVGAGMAAAGIGRHGTDPQRERYLPGIAAGERCVSVGIAGPGADPDAPAVDTTAVRSGDEYVLEGETARFPLADRADDVIVAARTTPREAVTRPTDGISLFVVDAAEVAVSPVQTLVDYAPAGAVALEDTRVPAANRLGEDGGGWRVLADLLVPGQLGFAAAATGVGTLAADAASRSVGGSDGRDGSGGSRRALSDPIAEAYARMEAAALMREKAAWLYDAGEDCGYETAVATATSASAGIDAVRHAMQAVGGWGDADLERWWREVTFTRLAAVTQQGTYDHIGSQVGYPRAY